MGIYYGEQSGKGFKAKLKVSEEELEKYLESWVLPNVVWFAFRLRMRNPSFFVPQFKECFCDHLNHDLALIFYRFC